MTFCKKQIAMIFCMKNNNTFMKENGGGGVH